MRKVFLIAILFVVFFNGQSVTAHQGEEKSFFTINDKLAELYPVSLTSLKNFILPEDLAPEKYLINQTLEFKIDKALLPKTKSDLNEADFIWDFGDGNFSRGLSASHRYSKMGSYLLTIKMSSQEQNLDNELLIQSILLHILPYPSYQLPKAVITINDKIISNSQQYSPITQNQISFSAKNSSDGSTRIVSYFWDKGNGESTTEKEYTHSYTKTRDSYFFPFLRVKDENGFINDTYVQLEKPSKKTTTSTLTKTTLFVIIIACNIAIIFGVIILFKKISPYKKT